MYKMWVKWGGMRDEHRMLVLISNDEKNKSMCRIPATCRREEKIQDGFNYDGNTLRAQNFKLVNWGKIQGVIKK